MFGWKVDDEIEIRLLEERHAEEMFHLVDANREHLRRWLPWLGASNTVDDTREFIASSLIRFAEQRGFQAAVLDRGAMCGAIGHHDIDWNNRATSLGYWLAAEHQGKGIMTRACGSIVQHAFDELGLNRVVIRCAIENQRSRAIPERLGFTLEGVARQAEWLYDHFVDLAVYAKLRID